MVLLFLIRNFEFFVNLFVLFIGLSICVVIHYRDEFVFLILQPLLLFLKEDQVLVTEFSSFFLIQWTGFLLLPQLLVFTLGLVFFISCVPVVEKHFVYKFLWVFTVIVGFLLFVITFRINSTFFLILFSLLKTRYFLVFDYYVDVTAYSWIVNFFLVYWFLFFCLLALLVLIFFVQKSINSAGVFFCRLILFLLFLLCLLFFFPSDPLLHFVVFISFVFFFEFVVLLKIFAIRYLGG